MELVTRTITQRERDHTPIVIAPIGDIQWAGKRGPTALDTLKRHIDLCLERNAWYVGLGDYPVPLRARALTRRGFVPHNELVIGEEVLGYNLATRRCQWTPIRALVYPGIQPILSLRSKSFRASCTPAHTWATTHNYEPTAAPRLTATDALRKYQKIIVAAPVDDTATSVLTAEEASILGWLCTDGHVRVHAGGASGYVIQTKEPHRTMLRGLLAEWITKEEIREPTYCSHCSHCQKFKGPKNRKESSAFHLKTKRLRQLFDNADIPLTSDYKAHLPNLIPRLSYEARTAMLSAMLTAEGWQQPNGGWWFSQKPGPVMDAFRILATLLGYRLSRGKMNQVGVFQILLMRHTVATVADLAITPQPPEEVFCLSTDLGSWVMDLDGQITITGNTDFLSPSNRQRVKSAALYDTANEVIDDAALHLVYELYEKVLKPTTGRWLGLVHGHHWAQLQTGETTDQRLCQLLQAKFLGTSAFIRLMFRHPKTETRCPLTIFVHHGCGGGMKASAPLNKLENILPYWDADIFLIGHMTKQAVAPINRISPRWAGQGAPDLVHRKIYIVGCGGFAKGYDKGSSLGNVPMGGYVEQSLMNPASLGAPLVKIVPRRDYTVMGGGSRKRGVWAPDVTVEV